MMSTHALVQNTCTRAIETVYVKSESLKYIDFYKLLQNSVNDDTVVTITKSGFSINMNNMLTNKPYIIMFDDSKYVAFKNTSDKLVIEEIPEYV